MTRLGRHGTCASAACDAPKLFFCDVPLGTLNVICFQRAKVPPQRNLFGFFAISARTSFIGICVAHMVSGDQGELSGAVYRSGFRFLRAHRARWRKKSMFRRRSLAESIRGSRADIRWWRHFSHANHLTIHRSFIFTCSRVTSTSRDYDRNFAIMLARLGNFRANAASPMCLRIDAQTLLICSSPHARTPEQAPAARQSAITALHSRDFP